MKDAKVFRSGEHWRSRKGHLYAIGEVVDGVAELIPVDGQGIWHRCHDWMTHGWEKVEVTANATAS